MSIHGQATATILRKNDIDRIRTLTSPSVQDNTAMTGRTQQDSHQSSISHNNAQRKVR